MWRSLQPHLCLFTDSVMWQCLERRSQLGQKNRISSHGCAAFCFSSLGRIFADVRGIEPRALHRINGRSPTELHASNSFLFSVEGGEVWLEC